jgi:hypothetical protein
VILRKCKPDECGLPFSERLEPVTRASVTSSSCELPADPVREIISELGSVPSSGSNAEAVSSQDDEVWPTFFGEARACDESERDFVVLRAHGLGIAAARGRPNQQKRLRSGSCSKQSRECSRYSRCTTAPISSLRLEPVTRASVTSSSCELTASALLPLEGTLPSSLTQNCLLMPST